MSWVDEFFVENSELYGSTVDKSLWEDGKKAARSILDIAKRLKLRRELRILDIPCGMGRVANPLAKLGCDVTGVDISPHYLKIAREKSGKSKARGMATYLEGRAEDLDTIVRTNKLPTFDVAISIHTILGYGSKKTDELFLKRLRGAVRRNGLLILTARRNQANIEKIVSEASFLESNGILTLLSNTYVKSQSRIYTTWRFYRPSGQKGEDFKLARRLHTSVRVYSTEEIVGMLAKTGWRVVEQAESINSRHKPISQESQGIFLLSRAI